MLSGIPRNNPQALCDTCKSLNLSADQFTVKPVSPPASGYLYRPNDAQPSIFEIGSGRGKFCLGPLGNIVDKSNRCPMCSLIARAAQEQTTEDLSEDSGPSRLRHFKCYISWQLDGRDKVGVMKTRVRTRRIRVSWEGKGLQDAYLVLLADYAWADDSLFHGRNVESSRANLALVRNWIQLCHQHHGETCEAQHREEFEEMRGESYFGVIDVQDMCLTSLPEGQRYIALSYTWKPEERFMTRTGNITNLQKPNGLKLKIDDIPRSIRDTIDLVRNLGERYLWVDSICIVQDSSDSWELNAAKMDRVYGNAYLTVCAADDPDASAGLVGLDPSRRVFTQHIEQYSPGVTLMVSHLSETYINQSRWNTRAWTFQERLLSRRCLLFTQGRVYFQCRATAMSEDIISENKDAGWSIELGHAPLHLLTNLDIRPLMVYTDCVQLYTARNLTRPEDILSAFHGISNLVGSKLRADFVYGLPDSHFDWTLLWEPQNAPSPRLPPNAKDIGPERVAKAKQTRFPSWSWCGWTGVIEYKASRLAGPLTNLHEWLMNRTWIIWYIRDGRGSLRMIRNKAEAPDHHEKKTEHRWCGYSIDGPAHLSSGDQYDAYGRRKIWPEKDGTTFYRTLPDFPYGVKMASKDANPDPLHPDKRFLQFWTWSATFRLTDQQANTSHLGRGLQRFGIADCNGDWCGTVVLSHSQSRTLGSGVAHEFIAISEAKNFAEEEYDGWTYYTATEKDQSEWDLYYVLLIEHDKDGIAHRVGLGKIYKEAFSRSCGGQMEWKELLLG